MRPRQRDRSKLIWFQIRLSFCENHGFSNTVPSGASSTSSMYWPRIGGVIMALNQKVSVTVSAVGGIVTVWRADE